MNISLLDFFFPHMCSICKRYGNYICDDCQKLLKRNLPECYICRRLSPSYASHKECIKRYSLDNVFVAWEYNHMSSSILKLYKYKNVQDISKVLSELFIPLIQKSSFVSVMKDTLLIPVPISNIRKNERGFNQMEYITKSIGKEFQLDIRNDLLCCRNSNSHQASKNKMERYGSKENPFYIKDSSPRFLLQYKSITIVDDVITTGNTLEKITQVIKIHYGMDTVVNALCMFRGKPYYLTTSQSLSL